MNTKYPGGFAATTFVHEQDRILSFGGQGESGCFTSSESTERGLPFRRGRFRDPDPTRLECLLDSVPDTLIDRRVEFLMDSAWNRHLRESQVQDFQ